MKLLTQAIEEQLISNHSRQLAARSRDEVIDFKPVVKLFTPDAGATWLLTELDPDPRIAFGLCDLGMGCPELGYVAMVELETICGALGLPVERDLYFKADKTLSEYADEAAKAQRIR